MIRITVELVPLGIEDRKKTLDTMIIANDATGGSLEIGNYNVRRGKSKLKGRVEGHHRLRESVWELVRKAIEATRKEMS